MASKVQRICGCGHLVGKAVRCPCEARRDAERKARFDTTRPTSSGRGYTGKWEKARKTYLAAHPWCKRCGAKAAVVDHKTPHRGDQSLFWDRTNWQGLCIPCHSGPKQREERRAAIASPVASTAKIFAARQTSIRNHAPAMAGPNEESQS